MHPNMSLDVKLAQLRSFTSQFYNVNILRASSLDEQMKKLKSITTTVIEENESKIKPTILHFIKLILDNLDCEGVVVDSHCRIIYMNEQGKRSAKEAIKKGAKMSTELCYIADPEICKQCRAKEALKCRQVLIYTFTSSTTGATFDCAAVPMTVNSFAVVMITAFRRG